MKRWVSIALLMSLALVAHSPASLACSILTLRDDATVLMANNEDYIEPGVIWFVPAKRGKLGRVNVGFKNDFAQGSMNEKGLAFDAAVVPDRPWVEDPEQPTPKNLLEKVMDECGTVAEAIELFRTHNCPHLSRSQFMFADATGDAAVIAWDPQNGVTATRIEGPHQIVTNTRLETSSYRCQRHARAEQVLESRGDVSVATAAAALEAIHQEGPGAFTSYSTIYDLKAGKVHVFNLANFEESVTFDLAAELKKKKRTLKLAELLGGEERLAALQAKPQRTDYATGVELTSELLDRYAGVYSPEGVPRVKVRVERDGKFLKVKNPGQPDARLFAESERVFRLAPDRGQVRFVVEGDQVVGLTLSKQADAHFDRVGDL